MNHEELREWDPLSVCELVEETHAQLLRKLASTPMDGAAGIAYMSGLNVVVFQSFQQMLDWFGWVELYRQGEIAEEGWRKLESSIWAKLETAAAELKKLEPPDPFQTLHEAVVTVVSSSMSTCRSLADHRQFQLLQERKNEILEPSVVVLREILASNRRLRMRLLAGE